MALASVLLGTDFELLAACKGNGAWWFIDIWLALSVLIAVLTDLHADRFDELHRFRHLEGGNRRQAHLRHH